jgi:hypothetical protein
MLCPASRAAEERVVAQLIEIPAELAPFELPEGVQAGQQAWLDQQDAGTPLPPA